MELSFIIHNFVTNKTNHMYTLDNIKTAPSYDALRRNGFSDSDCVAYYDAPFTERQAIFQKIKLGLSFQQPKAMPKPTPTATTSKRSLFAEVDREFKRLMRETFVVGGNSYNMTDLGYTYKWNNNKSRFGVHKVRGYRDFWGDAKFNIKQIELSKWLLDHAEKDFDGWVDTILHEIAHGIDYAIRGRSNHDWHWVKVARTIGCSGERCGSYKVEAKNTKYTVKCNNCGKETASHKHSKVIAQGRRACGDCCRKHNGGVFTKDYLLVQIQNY